jgi:hypothetical protein
MFTPVLAPADGFLCKPITLYRKPDGGVNGINRPLAEWGRREQVQSVGVHLMTLCLFLERGVDPSLGSDLTDG